MAGVTYTNTDNGTVTFHYTFFSLSYEVNSRPPFYLFLYFWPSHTTCGILVPGPGIEPAPPAVEARGLNHWTAREVPRPPFKV